MGKGTIVSSLGEGEYRVRLLRNIDRLLYRITVTEGLIADSQARLAGLEADAEAAQAALDAKRAEITAIITAAREANQHLVDALQSAIDALNDATSEADDAMAAMASFIQQRQLTLQSYDEQLAALDEAIENAETQEEIEALQLQKLALRMERDAYELQSGIDLQALRDDLTAKRTAQTAAAKTAQGAQEAFDKRDQKIKEINAALADAAKLETAYRAAADKLADEQLRLAGLVKDLQWLNANQGSDPEVTAWCADLTTTLTGTVATMEIPGERQDGTPVMIRPGYQSRSTYQSAEQHAQLVAAVGEAKRAIMDAALALAVARGNLAEAERQLADLEKQLDAAENKQPPAPAEMLASLRAQIETAELSVQTIDASIPGLETAVSDAESARDAAQSALEAARASYCVPDHSPEPRMADGQLQPAASSNPWATFWNQALLPAWQKWKPMYRIGEILSLSGDTCNIRLDPAYSTQQNISVNRAATLYGVRIEYMECNGAAFSVGDRVVVEFRYHDQTKPLVIGFEREPKQCGYFHGIIVTPCSSLSPEGWGDPLNGDPWGTPGVAPGHYVEMVDPPYSGASGGKGTQALLTWESDTPGGAKRLRMRHGAEWFPGVDMTKAVETRADHAAGGHIAVTRPLTAEDVEETGALKKGVTVYSLDRPWLSTRKGYFALGTEDLLEVGNSLPFGALLQFGDFRTGKTYRNGQFWQSSVMQSIGLIAGEGNQIIGIGVHKAEDGQEYIRIIVKHSHLAVGEYRYEDTSYLVSMQLDPPDYSSASVVSPIFRCDELARNFFLMQFNENATAAIGIGWAYRQRVGPSGLDTYMLEPDIVRCAFTNSGEGIFTHTKNEGCYATFGLWRALYHLDVNWPIAAGYCGNTEKILRYRYTHRFTEQYGPQLPHVYLNDDQLDRPSFYHATVHTETEYTINGASVELWSFGVDYGWDVEDRGADYEPFYERFLVVHYGEEHRETANYRALCVDFVNDVLYYIKQFSTFDRLPGMNRYTDNLSVFANTEKLAEIWDKEAISYVQT